jgi:large subunit ribosomal protein L5
MKDFAKHINEIVVPKIQKELGISNALAVPRIKKIVINVGIGSRMKTSKDYSVIEDNVSAITGQKPIVKMAKKAISNFKLREGTPNGIMTTLRRKKMLDFYNRMVNVAFPRIRDFQGFSEKAFDGNGNYSIGIKDCSIFPEINPDDLTLVHGMSISIVTDAKNDDEGRSLLKALNFPFKKAPKQDESAEAPEGAKEEEAPVEEVAEEIVEEAVPAEAAAIA